MSKWLLVRSNRKLPLVFKFVTSNKSQRLLSNKDFQVRMGSNPSESKEFTAKWLLNVTCNSFYWFLKFAIFTIRWYERENIDVLYGIIVQDVRNVDDCSWLTALDLLSMRQMYTDCFSEI